MDSAQKLCLAANFLFLFGLVLYLSIIIIERMNDIILYVLTALPGLTSSPSVEDISSTFVTVSWSSWIPCLDTGEGASSQLLSLPTDDGWRMGRGWWNRLGCGRGRSSTKNGVCIDWVGSRK